MRKIGVAFAALAAVLWYGPVAWAAQAEEPLPSQSAVAPSAGVREIEMTAKKYEFNPKSIRIKKGERLKLLITATDRDHGFKIDEFEINQVIKKGTTATIELTADKPGKFVFRCSHFCGFGHRKMRGELIVEEP